LTAICIRPPRYEVTTAPRSGVAAFWGAGDPSDVTVE
jgi:hypothetical protein